MKADDFSKMERTQSYLAARRVRPYAPTHDHYRDCELLPNLHVHIASVIAVVKLICSWCFCTCRSLMTTRAGCEQIFRCPGQTGEVPQGEPPPYPRGHDRLRILCSTLATNRERAPHHDEDSSPHHNRPECPLVEVGPGTSPSRLDRKTRLFALTRHSQSRYPANLLVVVMSQIA